MGLYPPLRQHRLLVWLAVLAFLALQFGVPMLHRLSGFRVIALSWLSYLSLSLVSTFFVYLLAADGIQALARRLFGAQPAFGAWAFGTAVTLTLLSAGIGLFQCYLPIRMRHLNLPIAGLPAELSGFRIAQISDLHLGPLLTPARVARVVAATTALAPDLVAVTGDLADGDVDQERESLTALAGLRATHGVFFVTGNHEYYSGAEPWILAVQALGWRVLENEHTVLEHKGASLAVIGLPDPTSRSMGSSGPDLRRALAGAPPEVTRLLLFHQPLGAEEAARAGVHLQLSGHTHGGQYFPWSLVVRLFFDHPVGLSQENGMWIYTSPGTGFWGPPNRFLVPPEITLFTLERQ